MSIAVLMSVVLIAPSSVGAIVSGTSGQVTKIPAPVSVGRSAGLSSLTTNWTWDEQQGVTLASNLTVDITRVGSYESAASLTSGHLGSIACRKAT